MGVYVEVKLHNGMPLAQIEIRRAHDQDQPEHSMDYSVPGRFRYRFRSVVKRPTSDFRWHLGGEVEHERTDDVLALLKAVIERLQELEEALHAEQEDDVLASDQLHGW